MPADQRTGKAPSEDSDVKYDVLMRDLQTVVERLESGELPLEDSLQAFEEGVRLVRRGEALLGRAEARIEQLLTEGGEDRAVPLEVSNKAGNGRRSKAPTIAAHGADEASDEDVPF